MTNAKRVASVRAETDCSLFSLSVDHFLSVLDHFPTMRRTMETEAKARIYRTTGQDRGGETPEDPGAAPRRDSSTDHRPGDAVVPSLSLGKRKCSRSEATMERDSVVALCVPETSGVVPERERRRRSSVSERDDDLKRSRLLLASSDKRHLVIPNLSLRPMQIPRLRKLRSADFL